MKVYTWQEKIDKIETYNPNNNIIQIKRNLKKYTNKKEINIIYIRRINNNKRTYYFNNNKDI